MDKKSDFGSLEQVFLRCVQPRLGHAHVLVWSGETAGNFRIADAKSSISPDQFVVQLPPKLNNSYLKANLHIPTASDSHLCVVMNLLPANPPVLAFSLHTSAPPASQVLDVKAYKAGCEQATNPLHLPPTPSPLVPTPSALPWRR